MSTKLQPGDGVYVIQDFDGESVTLKCSLEACTILTRQPGGLYRSTPNMPPSVVELLLTCDLDTMEMVMRAGLGLGPQAVPDLRHRIYRTGLVRMRDELAVFIGMVASGGRAPRVGDVEDGEKEGGGDADRPPVESAAS